MPEKFNKDYRAFAESAKEKGFEKDERKLVAMEPALILEGASEELRQHLSPEKLVSFFEILQGKEGVDSRHILDVGNFLYNYRPDKVEETEGKRVATLNEKDACLVDLACALLERAFYEGKLRGLKDESAASLAFTTNVLAKIFERQNGRQEAHRGFSEAKLEGFVRDVSAYEQKTLFPDGEEGKEISLREQQFAKMKIQIEETLKQADKINKETDWDKYFRELNSKLDSALKILEMAMYLPDGVIEVVEKIKRYQRLVLNAYRLAAIEIAKGDSQDFEKIKVIYEKPVNVLYDILTKDLPAGEERSRIFDALHYNDGFYEQAIKSQKKKAEKPVSKKPKILNSFEALAEIDSKERVPEALATLGVFFDKESGGPLGDYVKDLREARRFQSQIDVKADFDDFFQASRKRLEERFDRPAAVPYLIKSCLIVDHELAGQHASSEYKLATLNYPYDYRERGVTNPSHEFIRGELEVGAFGDTYRRASPAYASLHFIPEDMPFAVWAVKFLRLKGKTKDTKQTADK